MRSQRERLLDILRAIEEIEEYSCLGHDAYTQNKLIQGWMILQLERVGEAAARLSESAVGSVPKYRGKTLWV